MPRHIPAISLPNTIINVLTDHNITTHGFIPTAEPPFGHIISCKRVLTGFQLSGLTFGRDHLFYIDVDEQRIYEIHKETMALINSFATLGTQPCGLAWENENSIWYGDRVSHIVREVNPTTGALVSSFNAGFNVISIAYDGTHDCLWIGNEDTERIYMFTKAGVQVRYISAIAYTSAFGLTYVDPYLYVMGVYVEGVLIEMETSVTPLTPIKRYHVIKRGNMPYHGLAWDGEYLRLGSDSDYITNSIICKVQK